MGVVQDDGGDEYVPVLGIFLNEQDRDAVVAGGNEGGLVDPRQTREGQRSGINNNN